MREYNPIRERTAPMRWTVLIRRTKASGKPSHIQWNYRTNEPLLFKTRRECREYIEEHWGYQRTRADLKRAPHYCLMPIPIRVYVNLDPIKNRKIS